MKVFLCIIATCLLFSGCVAVSLEKAEFTGQVDLTQPLTRSGYLSLRFYTNEGGRERLVGQQRYKVNMLPLYYDFTVNNPSFSQGGVLLKADLSWRDEGAVQASTQKVIHPGKPTRIKLIPLSCFPGCTLGKSD